MTDTLERELSSRDRVGWATSQFSLIALALSVCFLLLKYYAASLYNRYQRMRVDDKPVYSKLGDAESWDTVAYLPAPYVRGEEVLNDSHRMALCFAAALLLTAFGAGATGNLGTAAVGVFSLLYMLCDCAYAPLALMHNPSQTLRRVAFAISCLTTLVLVTFAIFGASELSSWVSRPNSATSAALASAWATVVLLSTVVGLSLYNRYWWLLGSGRSAQHQLDDDKFASAPQSSAFLLGEQVVSELCYSNMAFLVSMLFLWLAAINNSSATLNAITAYASLFIVVQSVYLFVVLTPSGKIPNQELAAKILSGLTTFIGVFFSLWGMIGFIVAID